MRPGGTRPAAVRVYAALLRVLPGPVREADGEAMVRTFAEQWAEAERRGRRAGCLARAVGRFPWVAALEWKDHLAPRPGDAGGRALRHAARGLVRAPSFTVSAVLLLGLGVGVVTSVFTLVDHVLLRPLPYPAAERLVRVDNGAHSGPVLADLEGLGSVERWAAAATYDVNLTGDGEPLRLAEARVTESLFPLLGARPALGRLLVPDDWAAADVAVLSPEAWERVWGADPDVVGRTIRVDGVPVTVVGVVDGGWAPPEALLDGKTVDLWRPVDRAAPEYGERGFHVYSVVGLLRPGALLEDARAQADDLARRRAETYPGQYVERDGTVAELPLTPLQEATVGRARQGLELLLAAVTLLLLVACANVAHLFMARALARQREMAVRRALGAGRRSLAGQLLAESLLVAAAGAAVGVALGTLGLRAFMTLQPDALPRSAQVALDGRVLAFAVALSALTALVFGMVPALRLASRDAAAGLRAGGRGATGGRGARAARSGLVVAEVALSLVLVAQAGLLLRSFAALHRQDPGFRTEGVWTIPLNVRGVESADAWRRRMEAVRLELEGIPGVRQATYGLEMPYQYTGGGTCCWSSPTHLPGEEGGLRTMVHPVTPEFFDVMDVRPVAGGLWDRSGAGAVPTPAVLSEGLAVELLGSAAGAVGREVELGGTSVRVVGVVPDTRHYGPDREPQRGAYVPVEAVPFDPWDAVMAVRVDGAPADLPVRLREAVWRAEPDLPVPTVRSMEAWSAMATAGTRFDSFLFSAFGVAALLLAAGGLYGTLLYTVGMERRELGIRLALGARRASIVGRVLGRGLRMAVAGAAVGVVGAWMAGRLLASRLYGVEAGDPGTLAGAATVLLATAALASWLPARRAAATDPVTTLNEE